VSFLLVFLSKTLYAFHLPTHPTCCVYLIHLHLIILIMFSEEYKVYRSSICSFRQTHIISSRCGPNKYTTLHPRKPLAIYMLCSKTAKHVRHSVLEEGNFGLKIHFADNEYDLSKWMACAESVFCLSYVIDYLVTSQSLIFVITILFWLKRGLCRTTLTRGIMLMHLNNKGNIWSVLCSAVGFHSWILSFRIFIWQGGRRGGSVEGNSNGRVNSAN
jgi:hypothetical protein